MKKIKRTEDIIDVLTGDIDNIKTVRYYSHNEKDKLIQPTLTNNERAVIARIPSTLLQTLKAGQLCCIIELDSSDSDFADGKYDTIQDEGLDIWLV